MFNYKKLFSPCDASSLAFTRILIGVLLLLDTIYERGLSRADIMWSDNDPSVQCRFPLFPLVVPLSQKSMYAVYLVMLIGIIGVTVGFHYRICALIYALAYWYVFMLDRSRWNNHSYLFGLLSIMAVVNDANRKWSLDVFRKRIQPNQSVPFWQYFLLRFQIFIVYFYAGLKKTNPDWLLGYSMVNLSQNWVFTPVRKLVSDYWIDYVLIHIGGFVFDTVIGFLFVFSQTRPLAFVLCSIFNLTNSQMFQIGMFPWIMLALMPIYCEPDWPMKIWGKCFRSSKSTRDDAFGDEKLSTDCKSDLSKIQYFTLLLIGVYVCVQLVLPFAFVWLQGFNTWTAGIYGYNWDMMVHNWNHLHTRITVKIRDPQTNRTTFRYLNPDWWTHSRRWSHHADMVKQLVHCVHTRIDDGWHPLEPVAIYVDVWASLNGRFAQRLYDPRQNLLTARWSPLETPTWMFPLLPDSNERRRQYDHHFGQCNELIESEQQNGSLSLFLADFPGMSLHNYLETIFSDNVRVVVFDGLVKVTIVHMEQPQQANIQEFVLGSVGDCSNRTAPLPLGTLVTLSTIGHKPAYYALLYPKLYETKNQTEPNDRQTNSGETMSYYDQIENRNHFLTSLKFLYIGMEHFWLDIIWTLLRNTLKFIYDECLQ